MGVAEMMNWIIVGAAALTAFATVGLVVFAGFQLKSLVRSAVAADKTRSAQVFLKVLDTMNELRPSWHELYKLPDDCSRWDSSQKALADQVCVQLQRMAFLCERGLLDSDFVMDSYASVFISCWKKLEKYVEDYREQSGQPRLLKDGATLMAL